MMRYENQRELTAFLYRSFLDVMSDKGIYPLSGSGIDMIHLIENSVNAAVAKGEVPMRNYDIIDHTGSLAKLQELQDNIILLAKQMATDAAEQRSFELHEWSLNTARRKLCPLYPFFREPCI
ncbi:MAG: hypothetical protein JWR50_351 [Mucilaginibacter sp.]|nr:hypothetical protein [Mucilaginibacter sp.]